MTTTDRVTALRTAALGYAATGWRVFPLRPDDKRPAFPDHVAGRCTRTDPRCRDGHQGWETRATIDPDRITRAWTTTPYNIGIATGPSGLVVVDLDTPKPGHTPPAEWAADGVEHGAETLAVLAQRAGAAIPATYTVRTGRGGWHLYFTPPPGLRLDGTVKRLGWLVDTRAHGGYVVAAGSTVAAQPYTIECDQPPTNLPPWLATLLTPPAPPPARPSQGLHELLATAKRTDGYGSAVLSGEVHRILTAPPGTRNDTLNRAAFFTGQVVGAGILPRDLAEQALYEAGLTVGQKPGECTKTVRSGLDAGTRHPRTVPA
ncbi:bifunctional DNA primase/polymerase [Candidatus Protofrankia californiensis]|uniref:Bifunctional DNA primase/polymerase n=1 Tax=Candidatus Protofrankia californiensis TaxID=1839754 RepID=A0A1C3PGP4_9ACTN|nr:bifunctional DNA primase/polymerase [Candidatus Protofrankia californiensis]